jgi:hypothetical protein
MAGYVTSVAEAMAADKSKPHGTNTCNLFMTFLLEKGRMRTVGLPDGTVRLRTYYFCYRKGRLAALLMAGANYSLFESAAGFSGQGGTGGLFF